MTSDSSLPAPTPPESLVQYIRDRRCVLFAGAGLSAQAGLPGWRRLLTDIVDEGEFASASEASELRLLIETGKVLEVADHCKERLGGRYSDILSRELRGGDQEIPEAHRLVIELDFPAIVTTNYDKLLERAYSAVKGGALPRMLTHLEADDLGRLLFSGSFFILKAHGDIDKFSSLVLTTRDYREIIHSNQAFNAIFSAILLTKAILFVGYSLSDPDFRLLLDRQLTAFKGHVPERYAVMAGMSEVEREVLWRTSRVHVLPYAEGRHEQVVEFLKRLRDAAGRAPSKAFVPPAAKRGAQEKRSLIAASPSHVWSIRVRDRSLDHELISSTGAPIARGTAPGPDWAQVARLLRDAYGLLDAGKGYIDVGQELARSIPGDLLGSLDRLESGTVITLRLATEIERLPWEWTFISGKHLVERLALARGSVGISDDARGRPVLRRQPRALLIGDPTGELPGAREEVENIAQLYRKWPNASETTLLGSEAAFPRVVMELNEGDYDVVHFAGHAWFDGQEAYIALCDDETRANELCTLLSPRPPALLVLNSHFTAFVPPGVEAEDLRLRAAQVHMEGKEEPPTAESAKAAALVGKPGFTHAASRAGVGAFLGCFGSPSDAMAESIGWIFHRELLAGTPMAVALHRARLASRQTDDRDSTWLLYALTGYADLALASPESDRASQ